MTETIIKAVEALAEVDGIKSMKFTTNDRFPFEEAPWIAGVDNGNDTDSNTESDTSTESNSDDDDSNNDDNDEPPTSKPKENDSSDDEDSDDDKSIWTT